MRLWIGIASPELVSAGEIMGMVEDLEDLLNDTQADELLAFIGLKNQPILLPAKKGYRSAKRNIHFIRRHSLKPDIWVGQLHRGDEWIQVYKKMGDSTWRFVEYPTPENTPEKSEQK